MIIVHTDMPDFSPPRSSTTARDTSWREPVDRSTRKPVIAFITSGVFWLLFGTQLALIASFKFQFPDWLANGFILTFGTVRPVHTATMIYGWISMAGIGILVWLWARLLQTEARGIPLLLIACALFNTGVVVGVGGLLAGYTTGVEGLEMPGVTFVFIIPALLLVATSMMLTLRHRNVQHLYVSIWYLGAAIIWAPLLLLAVLIPTYTGVPHAIAHSWLAHNLTGLWITPMGLAAAYYFIPKVVGRPVYSYHLAFLGFWTLALFSPWAGVDYLVGGPVPGWLTTVSIAFGVMMVIPIAAVGVNYHLTLDGHFGRLRYSPTLRFIVFGAISYTVVGLQGALQALPFWQEVTRFTHYTTGQSHLAVYAFATMVAFGSIYYIMPRVTEWEWDSPRLISIHFWTTGAGILLMVASLTIGGLLQGFALLDPALSFTDVMNATKPWLAIRSVTGILIDVGHIAFAVLLYRIIAHRGSRKPGATYFQSIPVEATA